MKRLISILLLTGCATTTIRTPYGSYSSTKDISASNFHMLVKFNDTGQPTTIDVQWGDAQGNASAVNAVGWAGLAPVVESAVQGAVAGAIRERAIEERERAVRGEP